MYGSCPWQLGGIVVAVSVGILFGKGSTEALVNYCSCRAVDEIACKVNLPQVYVYTMRLLADPGSDGRQRSRTAQGDRDPANGIIKPLHALLQHRFSLCTWTSPHIPWTPETNPVTTVYMSGGQNVFVSPMPIESIWGCPLSISSVLECRQ